MAHSYNGNKPGSHPGNGSSILPCATVGQIVVVVHDYNDRENTGGQQKIYFLLVVRFNVAQLAERPMMERWEFDSRLERCVVTLVKLSLFYA